MQRIVNKTKIKALHKKEDIMKIYEMVKKIKRDFQELGLDNYYDVWEHIRSLNPHDGAKYKLYSCMIAGFGSSEWEGDMYFNMPATHDILDGIKAHPDWVNATAKIIGV